MKRGEIWTAAGGKDYAGKPRPVVVIQDDRFEGTASVTICAFTTDPTDAPLFRLQVEPSEANSLREPSRLMVDKITTVARDKLGSKIGCLDEADTQRLQPRDPGVHGNCGMSGRARASGIGINIDHTLEEFGQQSVRSRRAEGNRTSTR